MADTANHAKLTLLAMQAGAVLNCCPDEQREQLEEHFLDTFRNELHLGAEARGVMADALLLATVGAVPTRSFPLSSGERVDRLMAAREDALAGPDGRWDS